MAEPVAARASRSHAGAQAPYWTMSVPFVVSVAAVDRRLRPRDLSVLVVLYGELDPLAYRPVKHAWLARRVQMSRPNVVRAVGRLLDCGYLEQGSNDGGLCTYRMTNCVLPTEAQKKRRRT